MTDIKAALARGIDLLANVGRAIIGCKGLLAVIVLLAVLAGFTDQGRDLLEARSRADRADFLWMPAVDSYLAVLVYFAAQLTLTSWRPRTTTIEIAYAREAAPVVLGIVSGMMLPMLSRLLISPPDDAGESGAIYFLDVASVCFVLAGVALFRYLLPARSVIPGAQQESMETGALLGGFALAALWHWFPVMIFIFIFTGVLVGEWYWLQRRVQTAPPPTTSVSAAEGHSESGAATRNPSVSSGLVLTRAASGFSIACAIMLGAIFVGLAIWLWHDPLGAASFLGTLGVLIVFSGVAVTLGVLFDLLSRAGQRSPWPWTCAIALGIVFWCSLLLLLTGRYNEAPVRTLGEVCKANSTNQSTSVTQHVVKWLQQRKSDITNGSQPYPVYIVAAEGGGVRAAYWTAGVLSALHDTRADFTSHLLALSGVSGGSVGVGVFASLITAAYQGDLKGGQTLPCMTEGKLRPCVNQIVGADLLAAPFGAAMLGDLWRSMLSSPLFGPYRADVAPERSTLLEQALEKAFANATGSPLLAEPWDATWSGRAALITPLVIANSTSVQTSSRAVLTPLAADGAWRGAEDIGRQLPGNQVRTSTALLLSARFPGISTTAELCGMRLVDGGYSDNSGLASARELVNVLGNAAKEAGLLDRIEPVILVVQNGRRDIEPDGPTWVTWLLARLTASSTIIGVMRDPLATFGGLLNASPQVYRSLLNDALATMPHARIVQLPLRWEKTDKFPLGWVLSPHAAKKLDDRINELLDGQEVSGEIGPLRASGSATGKGQ